MLNAVPEPRRARGSRWFRLVWVIPLALIVLVGVVLAARGIRSLPATESFLEQFPGASQLPSTAPVGFPAWLAWQHGLNAFFLLFIVRSGWVLRRRERPANFWIRDNTRFPRTKGLPVRIGLPLWLHLAVDALWVINGVLFFVLIFATGQWVRIVPTRWDVAPNAVSAALQYASLDWPHENGWVNYNALQLISYFLVVFVAGPLALITGIRLTPGLATRLRPLDRVFPLSFARAIHVVVMLFFVAFIIVHVTLVLATGATNNLNHMYAVRNDQSPAGFVVFAASIVVMIVAWFAASPRVLRAIAATTGTVR